MNLQTLLSNLKGFNRTKSTGIVELDVTRRGKKYVVGKNDREQKIFYEIQKAETRRVLRRVVKPFETFLDGYTQATIYEPLVQLLKRDIPFSDDSSYQAQFEEYIRPRDFDGTSVSDEDLVNRVHDFLSQSPEQIRDLELLPEIYSSPTKKSDGRVVLNYEVLEGRADTPEGYKGFKMSVVGDNGKIIGYIKVDDLLRVSQYSPSKKILIWNGETTHEPYGIYTDGGFGFNVSLAKRVYHTPEQIAKWIANKTELGIETKENILNRLKI